MFSTRQQIKQQVSLYSKGHSVGFFAARVDKLGHTFASELKRKGSNMKKLIVGLAVVLALTACTASRIKHGEAAASSAIASVHVPSVSLPNVNASPTGNATGSNTLEVCAHYSGHVYEVCTAYLANSSLAVLVPYYKYATSSNGTLARYVSYRLGSRYTGQAKNVIVQRVKGWPTGTHDVAVPVIKILSVHSSLTTNTATLQTEESWKVTTKSGRVIYRETNRHHTVTMHRVQSYLLHKWVVTNLR